MNYKMIFYTLGQILKVLAALLILPLIVATIYQENTYLAFIVPIVSLMILGILLTLKKPEKKQIYAKEGFLIVGISWIILSLFGALPFIISGTITSFIDAFFETVSGFTTTGASILQDVEVLDKSILFWRSFTHWVGGMGILVFVLAILTNTDAKSIYILRAESPGPQVGKLVSKVKFTARILYFIYIVLTVLEIVFLSLGDMDLFESIVYSFGTAGTGGFSIDNLSLAVYSPYSQIVVGIFMFIFGINFNLFFLILIGNFKDVFKNEELRWYAIIMIISTITISLNVFYQYDHITPFGDTLRNAFLQVSSIMTTTGYTTTDFNLWPTLSKTILFLLMFIGASAGSTGGGIKVSRLIILLKSLGREFKIMVHPRSVQAIKMDGKIVDNQVVRGVNIYFFTLIMLFISGVILISFDGFSFETNIGAVAACINNIGPGFDVVGPVSNYSSFSWFSKLILSSAMLIGRLEIYPILMLFNPKIYSNK